MWRLLYSVPFYLFPLQTRAYCSCRTSSITIVQTFELLYNCWFRWSWENRLGNRHRVINYDCCENRGYLVNLFIQNTNEILGHREHTTGHNISSKNCRSPTNRWLRLDPENLSLPDCEVRGIPFSVHWIVLPVVLQRRVQSKKRCQKFDGKQITAFGLASLKTSTSFSRKTFRVHLI